MKGCTCKACNADAEMRAARRVARVLSNSLDSPQFRDIVLDNCPELFDAAAQYELQQQRAQTEATR